MLFNDIEKLRQITKLVLDKKTPAKTIIEIIQFCRDNFSQSMNDGPLFETRECADIASWVYEYSSRHPSLDNKYIDKVINSCVYTHHGYIFVDLYLAANTNLSYKQAHKLVDIYNRHAKYNIRLLNKAVRNKVNFYTETHNLLPSLPDYYFVNNPSMPPDILHAFTSLSGDCIDGRCDDWVAANPNTSSETLTKLSFGGEKTARAVAKNPSTPVSVLKALMKKRGARIAGFAYKNLKKRGLT